MEKLKRRILVVEDEGIIAMSLLSTLKKMGYEVPSTVRSGEAAIQKVSELEPDLVLMDINLAGAMDGIEAANRIREEFGTPVVFLTAYADNDTLQRAKLTEPYGYIVKPFSERELRIVSEIAIYKSEAVALLRTRAQQQAELAESSQEALSGASLPDLLQGAADRIARVLQIDCCEVLELLPEGRTLLLRAGVGWKDGLVGYGTSPVNLEDSLPGYTLASNEPVIVEDWQRETRFKPFLLEPAIVSALSVIIQGPIGPFGVLGVYSRKKRTFTQDDVNFLRAMANVISLVLQRKLEHEARAEAERASEGKTSLLRLLSHELRTPLTTLLLRLQLLQRDMEEPLSPRQQIGVKKASAAAMRLLDLIESMLEYARIESGQFIVHTEVLDLASLAGSAMEEIRPQAEQKHLNLQLLPGSSLPPLQSDLRLVRLIVINLLVNAIKYTQKGGIEVSVGYRANCHWLAVKDTGPGIPPEQQQIIFEPFEQLEPLHRKHTPGVGLGLALVKEMVEVLGGRIQLSSEVGVGSTFTVVLPPADH